MKAATVLLLMLGSADAHGVQLFRQTEKLPNGAVRVTNPRQGVWKQGTGWSLVPELQLGSADGPEPLIFAAITGLAVDEQGRMYVLDRTANELRIFSPAGKHLRSVGRTGAGPGEYRNANGLVWLARDTLGVVDQRGARYSILTREGAYIRSVPRLLSFYAWAFFGGAAGSRIYEQAPIGSGEIRRAALVGTSLLGDGVRDTVLLPVPKGPKGEFFSIQTKDRGMSMGVPFAPSAVYHLDAKGRIWHGNSSEFRLFRTSFKGDTTLEVLLDAQPAPVGKEELAEWDQGPGPTQFREMGGKLDYSKIPKVKPFFDGLYQSPEGDLWVSVPTVPNETAFAVFNAEGHYLGRLTAKGVTRSTFISPVVRNDRLYLAGQDEDDVPKVFVFRIEKRKPESP